ncbi:MAG: outer membrane lipoprotein LolB [Gammaproteobacteria bacterium]|nr:outer membrane lipoprotein LolB [Gammaproteobacteria bacterium]
MTTALPRAVTIVVMLALGLGACTRETLRPAPTGDWEAHVAAVNQRANWALNGKIGVRAASGSGSAALGWQQQGANYRLVLSGALGMGKLVLSGDRDGVSWTDQQGQPRHHPDPDLLVRELWGWNVPVAALQFWVRGIPQPDKPYDEAAIINSEAASFRQSGWLVKPGSYRDIEGISLPTRIRLEGQDAVLTVLVNRWSASPP